MKTALLFTVLTAGAAFGQKPSAWLNEDLPSWLQFSGEYRARLEGFENGGFKPNDSDMYGLSRLRLNARIKQLLAADTGQDPERISHDINRDYWMSALEAQEYGLIDTIVGATDASLAADRAEAALDTPKNGHINGKV